MQQERFETTVVQKQRTGIRTVVPVKSTNPKPAPEPTKQKEKPNDRAAQKPLPQKEPETETNIPVKHSRCNDDLLLLVTPSIHKTSEYVWSIWSIFLLFKSHGIVMT